MMTLLLLLSRSLRQCEGHNQVLGNTLSRGLSGARSFHEFANFANRQRTLAKGRHVLVRLYGRMSITLVQEPLPDVGPEFLKSVGRQESANAFCATHEGVMRIRLTVSTPGI